ncbi:complement component receptor 1-like protein isoform X2 [Pyxicephalus adspersus]|uniref:complement component receptor 1-like protein isoform X2 n=1 Tax=Pyxicephalus adspersus TaxID=30357 RepID=UPI003B5C610C
MKRTCLSSVPWFFLLYSFIAGVHCDCGPPPTIPFGRPKQEFADQGTFAVASAVKYDCLPGFIRVPGAKNHVTCLENSKWTSNEEFCKLRSCGFPGEIENGYFAAENFYFSSRVTYYCDMGYVMASKRNYRDCQADGTWSNSPPTCEAVICPPPPTIPNGTFYPVKEEYYFSDAVKYTCSKPNMVMEYDSSIFCLENGNWSDPEPHCIEVNCEPPNVPHSKKLLGFVGPYSLNSIMRFQCLEGFTMEGSDTIVCNMDSIWEPSPPECKGTFCPDPIIINGKITQGKKTYGYYMYDSINVACYSGYKLKGERRLTCKPNFEWSHKFPICELKYGCSSPQIANGRISRKNSIPYNPDIDGHGFSTSDEIEISCNNGYRLSGSSWSTCKSSGIFFKTYDWSPTLPTCQIDSYTKPKQNDYWY